MKLIGPSIWQQTAASFAEYTATLRRLRPNNNAKCVPDTSIVWGEKIIVRTKRKTRLFTELEVAMLAAEYGKDASELIALFTKRKIRIANEAGDIINGPKPKIRGSKHPHAGKSPAKRGGKRTAKKNDDSNEVAIGAVASSDQLQQPGATADLPPQSTIQPADEPEANR